MNREEVYQAIDSERDYQDEQWGGNSHDNKHSIAEWLLFIEEHLNRAKFKLYYEHTSKEALNELRKIAGLCVAAGEVHGMPVRISPMQRPLTPDKMVEGNTKIIKATYGENVQKVVSGRIENANDKYGTIV